MLKTLAVVLSLYSFSSFGATTLISTEAFCDKVQGVYNISDANGVKPKPEAEVGSIDKDLETKECVFSFPFCIPNGPCDTGYHFFGFENTQVNEISGGVFESHFEISTQINGKPAKYLLSVGPDSFHFRNFQYTLPDGTVVVLEHSGKKN